MRDLPSGYVFLPLSRRKQKHYWLPKLRVKPNHKKHTENFINEKNDKKNDYSNKE